MMVQPPRPWPQQPTLEGHRSFELHALAMEGKTAALQAFFCHGLPAGSTAHQIMTAAFTGDAEAMKAALTRTDALPDFANANGLSPLMVACARGHKMTADLLAAHPLVQLNRQSADGWTALHYAAWMQHKDVITMLLDHLANPAVKNSAGKPPYILAREQNCGDAFDDNRAFIRFMKRHDPSALPAPPPDVAQPPQAQEETPAPITAPVPAPAKEESIFKKGMAQMVVNLGMSWKLGGNDSMRSKIYEELAGMSAEDFKASFKSIEAARQKINNEFRWEHVFIAAARQGNTDVMREIHRDLLMLDGTVDRALLAAVSGKSDNADAVHHLMAWGADPFLMNNEKQSPIYKALYSLHAGAFEEMVVWNKRPVSDESLRSLDTVKQLVHLRALRITDKPRKDGRRLRMTDEERKKLSQINNAMMILRAKQDLRAARKGKLHKVFNNAVNNNEAVMMTAAYAESQNDRFFRGMVAMPEASGNDAVAVALLHDKFNLAVRMASDGHDIRKAKPALLAALRSGGSDKAREVAQKLMDGKADLTPISRITPSPESLIVYPMFYGRGGF